MKFMLYHMCLWGHGCAMWICIISNVCTHLHICECVTGNMRKWQRQVPVVHHMRPLVCDTLQHEHHSESLHPLKPWSAGPEHNTVCTPAERLAPAWTFIRGLSISHFNSCFIRWPSITKICIPSHSTHALMPESEVEDGWEPTGWRNEMS